MLRFPSTFCGRSLFFADSSSLGKISAVAAWPDHVGNIESAIEIRKIWAQYIFWDFYLARFFYWRYYLLKLLVSWAASRRNWLKWLHVSLGANVDWRAAKESLLLIPLGSRHCADRVAALTVITRGEPHLRFVACHHDLCGKGSWIGSGFSRQSLLLIFKHTWNAYLILFSTLYIAAIYYLSECRLLKFKIIFFLEILILNAARCVALLIHLFLIFCLQDRDFSLLLLLLLAGADY